MSDGDRERLLRRAANAGDMEASTELSQILARRSPPAGVEREALDVLLAALGGESRCTSSYDLVEWAKESARAVLAMRATLNEGLGPE